MKSFALPLLALSAAVGAFPAAAAPTNAAAAIATPSVFTGEMLLDMWHDEGVNRREIQLRLEGYVVGVAESFNGTDFCVDFSNPKDGVVAAVGRYLETHDKAIRLTGVQATRAALAADFPCRK